MRKTTEAYRGAVCKRGHDSLRYRSGGCIECAKEKGKGRYKLPHVIAYQKKWRDANRDKIRKKNREWKDRNPERRKELDRRFRERNPNYEKERARRRYEKDPKRWHAKSKKWMRENPFEAGLINRRASAQRRYLIINNGGKFTKRDIEEMMKRQSGRCAYCCKDLHGKFTVDHIVPLTKGGTSWPHNLTLTCRLCNIRKSDTSPSTYVGKVLSGYYKN